MFNYSGIELIFREVTHEPGRLDANNRRKCKSCHTVLRLLLFAMINNCQANEGAVRCSWAGGRPCLANVLWFCAACYFLPADAFTSFIIARPERFAHRREATWLIDSVTVPIIYIIRIRAAPATLFALNKKKKILTNTREKKQFLC